jgi:ABC-type phosphate transport system auxiliary subunit
MAPALPYIAVGTSVLAATQASAIGKFNQAVLNRNAQVAEQEADQARKLGYYNIQKFNQQFEKLQSKTKVGLLKSGVELSGTALKILQSNAEQAELNRDVIEYNSNVAAARKLEEANFARITGNLRRMEGRLAALGYISQAGTSLMSTNQVFGGGSPQGQFGSTANNITFSNYS